MECEVTSIEKNKRQKSIVVATYFERHKLEALASLEVFCIRESHLLDKGSGRRTRRL